MCVCCFDLLPYITQQIKNQSKRRGTRLIRKVVFVLLCFINPILRNRYCPGVSSCQQTSDKNLGWQDSHPPPSQVWRFMSYITIIFFCVLPPHSYRAYYIRNAHRWCAVTRKPRSAWLEGTPAIHVTSSYVSWYVRVVDTHSILKCYFLDLSSRKGYCVAISHRNKSKLLRD